MTTPTSTRRSKLTPAPTPPAPAPQAPSTSSQKSLTLRVTPTGRFRIFAHPLNVYFIPDQWVEVPPHPWVLRQIQLGSLMAEDE